MIARDATVWVGQINMTGHMNALALDLGREPQDKTRFQEKMRTSSAGLATCDADLEGFWNAPLDAQIHSEQDREAVMSCVVRGDGKTAGDLVYFFGAQVLDYEPGAAVGDEYQFGLSAMFAAVEGDGREVPVIRGFVLDNREGVSETSDTPSAGYNFGALLATERLWAAVHVFDIVGSTSWDLDIQASPAGPPLNWQDRVNFPAMNQVGSFAKTITGPVTDTLWRAQITVTDPPPPDSMNTIDFAVVIGKETIR